MLFCLLHPMDHNTGPLARKSTTLCALLLVSIAALLLLPVPGQANGEEVGVANHIKNGSDVTLKGDSKPAGEDLTYAEYVKRFPTVCNFAINKTHIELLYDGRNCTVELITKETNMIKFKTGMKSSCDLEDCRGQMPNFEHGFANLLPFAYSRNNKDITEHNKGPIEVNDNAVCGASTKCGKDQKCINQTFLEVSWSKCQDFVHAHIHLIGEYRTGLDRSEEGQNGTKREFNLEIYNNSRVKMDLDPKRADEFFEMESYCAPKKNPLVNPETWKIKNEDKGLKGKHLLVFHLLPQTATIRYKNNAYKGTLKEKGPNCTFFISFDRPAYEFLHVDLTTTTTSTTTTTKPSTKSSTTPTKSIGTTPTPRPQQGTTTNVEVKDTKKGSSAGKVIFVLLVLVFVSAMIGVCVYAGLDYRKKQQKEKEEEEATKAAATEAAAAEAAATEAAEAEDEKERAFWFNLGDEEEIAEQNRKLAVINLGSVHNIFVNEIYERMEKEDEENAEKNEKILYELYLPALEEKGFAKVGTFREWRKKSAMIPEKGETLEEFNKRVEDAIKTRRALKVTLNKIVRKKPSKDEAAGGKKTENSKVKNDQAPKEETTSKDSALQKDPAPEKSDAAKSKQAGTTSDVPTDMVSEAKETEQ
ncbi:unnamed protein product [Meloidogyne enterolobii]|uniref:Uncharacterized protein n=1 Tax=Meloidogyne enterolobii TaxID=390850 RepID=A0ACB0Z068_MELEN